MAGSIQDITDRKEKERQITQHQMELARSNEDLQQFASVASHDLQEPLRMVSSYTQLLQKRYAGKLDEDADQFIEYAVDGANRMKRLIRDLLEYSKVGKGSKTMAMIDSENVVREAMKNIQQLVDERHAQIRWKHLPNIRCDVTRLILVFQNILGNAIKFCEPSITPCITVHAETREVHWLFSIQDNGIGIQSDYTSRIFEVFQRLHTRESYGGTGIGLAICKRIVESHGGQIWVESMLGQGSTFFFTVAK